MDRTHSSHITLQVSLQARLEILIIIFLLCASVSSSLQVGILTPDSHVNYLEILNCNKTC